MQSDILLLGFLRMVSRFMSTETAFHTMEHVRGRLGIAQCCDIRDRSPIHCASLRFEDGLLILPI